MKDDELVSMQLLVKALQDERDRLREFAQAVISPCEWGPTAFLTDNEEDIAEAALRLGVFRIIPHAQPCEIEGCECDGARELWGWAWEGVL